jgi:hypothetical protein
MQPLVVKWEADFYFSFNPFDIVLEIWKYSLVLVHIRCYDDLSWVIKFFQNEVIYKQLYKFYHS